VDKNLNDHRHIVIAISDEEAINRDKVDPTRLLILPPSFNDDDVMCACVFRRSRLRQIKAIDSSSVERNRAADDVQVTN